MPAEPPATGALPKSLSPISMCTRSSGTSSTSAAICAITVRAPVPMSVAPTCTVKLPSPFRFARACDGRRRAGYVEAATPRPRSVPPDAPWAGAPAEAIGALAQAGDEVARREAVAALGVDLRVVQHAQLDRVDPGARASSSIADSSANMPGHSPGARIHDGVGTSSFASRCVVRRFGDA